MSIRHVRPGNSNDLEIKTSETAENKNNDQTTGKKRDPLSFMNVEFVRLESPVSEFFGLDPV